MIAMKNYRILMRKDLEDMRELTRREGANRWVGRPKGGVGWPHLFSFCGGFLMDISNPYLIPKSIFIHYKM
jgi:hypothetical protein